jgi:hypothetical protein
VLLMNFVNNKGELVYVDTFTSQIK